MKVIVADKISERGVELLKKTGWNIVQTTKESLAGELADAEALIVRSATRVTPELMDKAPHLRVVGRAGVAWTILIWMRPPSAASSVMSTPGGSGERGRTHHRLAAITGCDPRASGFVTRANCLKSERTCFAARFWRVC